MGHTEEDDYGDIINKDDVDEDNHFEENITEEKLEKGFTQRMRDKQLTDAFEKLPQDQKNKVLEIITMSDNKKRANGLKAFKEATKYTPPPLPEKNSGYETYPEFKSRTDSTDGLECLKQNWGTWLQAYNPELKVQGIDYLHKGLLRNLDKTLMKRIEKLYTKENIAKYIPTKECYGNQRIHMFPPEEAKASIKNRNIVISKGLHLLTS